MLVALFRKLQPRVGMLWSEFGDVEFIGVLLLEIAMIIAILTICFSAVFFPYYALSLIINSGFLGKILSAILIINSIIVIFFSEPAMMVAAMKPVLERFLLKEVHSQRRRRSLRIPAG
jgi:hypothetical protein